MFWLPQSSIISRMLISFMLCQYRGKGGMRNSNSRKIWSQIIAKAFLININTSITVISVLDSGIGGRMPNWHL
jgi:hypothetical protein